MDKELILDEKAVGEIASEVSKGVQPAIDEAVAKAMETKEAEFQLKLESLENVAKKSLAEKDSEATERKEVRFIKSVIALANGDKEALKGYNSKSMDMRTKAGYANTDVNADGGYIVADPEFEAAIESLSEEYGVAFREADVRPISRNSIKTNKRGSNVTMFETGQGVAKTGTKLTIEQVTVELRKFAAIAIATDELVEDSAIDFWAEVTAGFAEERARIADELVFTDDDETYPGVLRTPGVYVETVGASLTSITWDDLLNAEAKVPTKAGANAKYYMHRTVWNIIRQAKDDEGRYQMLPTAGLQTPWGKQVVLVDVMPDSATVGDSNEPFIVYGDLKRVKLYVKGGLTLTIGTEGTVADSLGSDVNLFEQDMTALRAVTRMAALVKFPEAFVLIGTGTVS